MIIFLRIKLVLQQGETFYEIIKILKYARDFNQRIAD